MTVSLDRVQTPMPFFPPQMDSRVLAIARWLLVPWVRRRRRIAQVEARHVERLVELTGQFQTGKARYILAFRHPTTDDQYILFHLLVRDLPRIARQMGVSFSQPTYSYFVYDRGIPLWAGKIVNWFYPRLGGIPIYRGKLDRQGLQHIRKHLVEGDYPVAISPEGGTNGHSELVAPIEPGVAQMGFWAAEDLAKAGRSQPVYIVPIGIQYQYLGDIWENVDRFLMTIERECGLEKPPVQPGDRYERLYGLGEHLLTVVESHYQKYYPTFNPEPQASGDLGTRLQALLDGILRVAETNLDIKPKGSFVDRCRRLEQAGWDRIFRNDVADVTALSALEKGFADQLAKEANSSHWHMRIAESLTSVSGSYVRDRPSPTRYAETLLLIYRALGRVKQLPFGSEPYLGDRKAIVSVGKPLCLSDRWERYQSSRTAARACVDELTTELQAALEKLIEPSPLENSL